MDTAAPSLRELLNWEVTKAPVYVKTQEQQKYKAIQRSDSGETLAILPSTYMPFPNEKFIELVEKTCESGGFTFESYTEFQGGARQLVYLKNPKKGKVGDFEIDDYLVLANSHNYSFSLFGASDTQLLRCENRFRLPALFKIKHSKRMEVRIEQIQQMLQGYDLQRKQYLQTFDDYSKVEVDDKLIQQCINYLLNIEGKTEISAQKQKRFDIIKDCIEGETEQLGNNLWGLLNGVTFYTSHIAESKERTYSQLNGILARMNLKANNFCSKVLVSR